MIKKYLSYVKKEWLDCSFKQKCFYILLFLVLFILLDSCCKYSIVKADENNINFVEINLSEDSPIKTYIEDYQNTVNTRSFGVLIKIYENQIQCYRFRNSSTVFSVDDNTISVFMATQDIYYFDLDEHIHNENVATTISLYDPVMYLNIRVSNLETSYNGLTFGPPDQPDNPDNPDNPDIPDNPDNPDNPDQPDNPDNPDIPDNPDNPDLNIVVEYLSDIKNVLFLNSLIYSGLLIFAILGGKE